ncbi:hypothetical protein KUV51_05225 [Tateyamaria omphalii]|nr:hypothetical protein [Tateyamaria omphalii]MBY5932393.1 hypothetical protein [Tateyamaria omphalii]
MNAKTALMLVALLFAAACGDPDSYPISGEACSPDDPVQDLQVDMCAPTP